MKLLLSALCALFTLAYVMADCPNQCSGHGTCGKENRCTCYPGYGDADCSHRSCPYGLNIATGALAECSGRGQCDAKNGDCKCDAGYEGEDCGRTSCPGDCSGHGSCTGDVQRSCDCDYGYSGPDCSSRLCPKGDDPLSTETYPGSGKEQQDEIQAVDISLTSSGWTIDGDFVLSFTDAYGGYWTTRPVTLSDSTTYDDAQVLEDIIESLPNQVVPDVTVSKTTKAASQSVFKITFNSAANSGDVAPLSCHTSGCNLDGCQPRYSGVLKKKSAFNPYATNVGTSFFSEKQPTATITVDLTGNTLTVNSATSISLATAVFSKTATPMVGAPIRVSFGGTTTTTTVASVSNTGITTAGNLHASSGTVTTGNLVLAYENPANIIAAMGQTTISLTDAMGGLAAATADITIGVVSNAITIAGTDAAAVDLTNFVVLGDTIVCSAFVATGNSGNTLVVTGVAAKTITATDSGVALTDQAAATTGATNQCTITKSKTVFDQVLVGDTLEVSGSGKNNKKFTVIGTTSDKRSVSVSGAPIYTETAAAKVSIVIRRPATSAEATCAVTEEKKGTKESLVCAGRGVCDGSSGVCACFSGYTGENCAKQNKDM